MAGNASRWRPAETAPIGVVIDAWSEAARARIPNVIFDSSGWRQAGDSSGARFRNISHWMPMPAPPIPDAPKLLRMPQSLHSLEDLLKVATNEDPDCAILIGGYEDSTALTTLFFNVPTIFQANWTYDMAKQMLLTPELYMQGK